MTVETRAPAHGSDEILRDLNPEQRQAVTAGPGPLLIVAGAGTGKTQVITRRIAWLIASKAARPEEILALTFTDKAATEMESRVDVLVPYGYTGATISTFHAFGDRLVREFGIELGITGRLRICTDAEVRVFLRERLFELGLVRYAPLGRPDTHLAALLKCFGRARDEDVSPEEYRRYAEKLAAEAYDDASRDEAEGEIEKALAYSRYRDLLLRNGRLDFGDQVAIALRILRERPHVLRQLHDRYRWILVDEFQDTNHAQFETLRLLAGTKANLTVVGDDDQSIYRFRGAKPANLMAFLETFPQAQTVVLTTNYRSRQNLLDASYQLIAYNNPDRLEAQLQKRAGGQRFVKRLRADAPGLGVVEHREFHSGSDEADWVANRIADEVRAGRRGPGEFAVLVRRHRDLPPFVVALESQGIAYQQSNQTRLYAREEVRLCLALLRAVADPDDSAAVFQLLADPLFGADDTDLARLSSLASRRNQSLRRALEQIEREPLLQEVAESTRDACARLLSLLRQLAHLATRRPTTDVLYAFVHESGYLGQLTAQDSPESEEKVRNLAKLFTITKRVGEVLEENRVHAFIRHLDLLIEAGDDPAAAEVEVDRNAVHLITAHNAKGLEFPVVFLVAASDRIFPGRQRGEPLAFPPALMKEPPTTGSANDQEERRLFYVAMTRAREELHVSWAVDYGWKDRHRMSPFVAEAFGLPARGRDRDAPSPREAIERHAPAPVAPAATRAPLAELDLLALSSARVDDYLTCPLKYRYAHEVKVPLASDPRFMYGTAIHHAILEYYRHRLRGYPIDPDTVVRVFENSWSSDGFISREHEERRLEQGRATLRRFVQREDASPHRPVLVEQSFQFRRGLDQVTGRWDRIDDRSGAIVIVDFKTSDVDENENATKRAVESLRSAQLGLYALAYNETRGVMPARTELHYVDSGIVGGANVDASHLEAARERIVTAATGIRAARFEPKPEYNACRHCPYNIFCPHSITRSGR
jgi:DNA helicase II / ATP-dependent DNA helicase PcrA